MNGVFEPYVHDPECATNPFAGVCFAAYDAALGFVSEAYPTRESLSIYGQATYNVQDDLRYIFGMRYTEDSFSSDVTNFFGLQTYLIEDEIDETTGKFAVEHDIDSNTMVYASYTRGFKPGGSNLTFGYPVDDEQAFGSNPAPQLIFPLFESEIIDAFEVGLKTDFRDGRMRANISAFSYDYENLQFQSTDPDIYRGGVANIPESKMSGVELEMIGILSDSLSMDLRLSSLNTKISSDYEALDNIKSELYFFGNEPERYALRENINGNKLAKSPEFTANLGLQYDGKLKSGMPLRATAEVIHRGDFQQRVFNNPFVDKVDSYTVLNFTTSVEVDEKTGIDFMILNATDKDGMNSAMTDVFGVAGTGVELIPPRQFILRLRKQY
jgi:iron complex outermembrane receptor protein